MNKKNIYIMFAIALLQGMVFYGPIATLYRQAHGISILQITIIESISLALCLLLELPWGIIADKIGYKRSMIICCVLYFVSKIIFWQAAGFAAFLLERVLLSVVIAGLSGVDTSILYLSCEKGESHKVFGIYNSLQTTGLLIAAFVFSTAVGDNYKLSGLLTVISYGIAALLSLGLKDVSPEKCNSFYAQEFVSLLRQTFKNKHLLLFLIGVTFLSETHQTITVFLNQLQYVKSGLSSSTIGYIYIAVTIAGLSGIFSSRLIKKANIARTVGFIYTASMVACVLLAFTTSAWLSVAGILIIRILYSIFQPLQMNLQNKQVFTQNRATALSMNAIIMDSVGIGTNVAFGYLADYSLTLAFLLGAGLCLFGLIMFIVWYRNQSDTTQNALILDK
ncbi:MFS transporter [[Clostridium] fimetarium]|uniref:Predicted arabinose efflux permease, MFS family n=1 Tax=[Clostridium] fimetarium TaxID=99656 RepID=A0A1I0M6H2_9FIRM|nr:MFS transporter [[Clostridium] fimetarium]SEV83380.1 Predicted arabinose efflux permease, MFS family [[Clostridium] fimetarium]